MLDRVDSFAVSPALPDSLPEIRPVIEDIGAEFAELDEFLTEAPEAVTEVPSLPIDDEEE